MAVHDWCRVIDQAAELGVAMVQFIGGEPTLHPGLPELLTHALARRMEVEVFSNLVHVGAALWELFSLPGVSLATSYYSDDPAEHAAIVKRPTYRRTRANIVEAVRRGVPLRAGVIGLDDAQRTREAAEELARLGVTTIGADHLRQVGRGVRDQRPTLDQLCGRCGNGVAAISPDGAVWPCVFARWLPMGNIIRTPLADVLASDAARDIDRVLATAFAPREAPRVCRPDKNAPCQPDRCKPANRCDPACSPNDRQCRPASTPCYPQCNPTPCDPTCSPRCGPSCNPCSPCQPAGTCWPGFG